MGLQDSDQGPSIRRMARQRNASNVRVLVDGCRPLDIRHESDPEYFCRYFPHLIFTNALVGFLEEVVLNEPN